MSTISELKKLLEAADSNECFTSERASNRIRALAGAIALALVESQTALLEVMGQVGGFLPHKTECEARTALRMDDLVKAMEKKR